MYEKINNLMISKTISIKYKDFLCCEKKNFKSKFYIANISKVCNQIKSKIKSHQDFLKMPCRIKLYLNGTAIKKMTTFVCGFPNTKMETM